MCDSVGFVYLLNIHGDRRQPRLQLLEASHQLAHHLALCRHLNHLEEDTYKQLHIFTLMHIDILSRSTWSPS